MPIRVLIVDTDENFCQNVSQRLLIEKYQVLVTVDVMEAKKIVQKEKIDVVLLGLKGLEQRGLSLLASIKRMRPSTEVILMLPAGHLSLSIEGMRLGAFDDLLMPFDIETLLSRIKAADQHRQTRKKTKKAPLHRSRKSLGECGKSVHSRAEQRPCTDDTPGNSRGAEKKES